MDTRAKKQTDDGSAGLHSPREGDRVGVSGECSPVLESFIHKLSSTLAAVDSGKLDDNVRTALGQICVVAGADRATLCQLSHDGERLSTTHEWRAPDVPSVMDPANDLPCHELPWVTERMKDRETIALQSIADLPAEAAAEKVEYQLQDICSLVLLPVHFAGSLAGILTLCTIREERSWPDKTIHILKIAGEIFAHALVGHRSERYLRENEKKYQRLVETMNDALITMDEQGVITFANDRFCRMLGQEQKEILGRCAANVITPLHSSLLGGRNAPGADRPNGSYEVSLLHKDGHDVPADLSSTIIHDPEGKYRGTTAIIRDNTDRKRAENALRDRAEAFEILNKVVSLGNEAEDLDSLLENVLGSTLGLMVFEAGGIYLIDKDRGVAELQCHTGLPAGFLDATREKRIDQEPYSTVFSAGQPLIMNNYADFNPDLAQRFHFLSTASIPLFHREKVIGALNVTSKMRHTISDSEKNILLSIGRQAGTLIHKMRAEENLREKTAHLEMVREVARIGHFEYNLHTKEFSWSDGVYNIFGVDRNAFKPSADTIREAVHPDDLERVLEAATAATLRTDPVFIEHRILLPDGTIQHAAVRLRGILDTEGEATRVIGVIRNTTTQKESERTLRESEWRFRSVFNLTPVAVFLETADGDILDANAEAESLTGYSTRELLRKNAGDLLLTIPEPDRTDWAQQPIAAKGNFTEGVCLHKNGNRIPIRVHAQLIRGDHKDLVLLVAEDIQDRKKYERRMREHSDLLTHEVETRTKSLRAANTLLQDEIREREAAQNALSDLNRRLEGRVRDRTAELEKSDRELRRIDKRKDAFVSMVSHELRTPLTCILSSSEYLLGNCDNRVCQKEYIEIIHAESERLIRFINDVLDLSRIEAGGMPWNDGFLPVQDVVDHVLWIQEQMISKKSICMETDVGSDLYVFADHDRIQQVLTNLVTNAIKFSSENGRLQIAGEMTREKKNGKTTDWVRITIADRGIGIAENALETIFDKFSQITTQGEGVNVPGGSGLGLPICREIVEHYGGRIWAESKLGEGSSFIFTLPSVSPAAVRDENQPDVAPDNNRAGDTQENMTGRQ